jgi:hypothetical protein
LLTSLLKSSLFVNALQPQASNLKGKYHDNLHHHHHRDVHLASS